MNFEQICPSGATGKHESLDAYLEEFLQLVAKKIKVAVTMAELEQENVVVHSIGLYRDKKDGQKGVALQLHFAALGLEQLTQALRDKTSTTTEEQVTWPEEL